MHGGPAHTPQRRYSDDMLVELGVALPGSVTEAGDQLRDDGFTFLDLKHFCAPLGPLLMMRFELGLRSPINTLARSLNPAGAPLSMQSVFHPAYLELHLGASRLCGDRDLLLFKGEGGEPEIRPDARTALTGLRHGEPAEAVLDAALPRQAPPGEVSPAHVRAVWRGRRRTPTAWPRFVAPWPRCCGAGEGGIPGTRPEGRRGPLGSPRAPGALKRPGLP